MVTCPIRKRPGASALGVAILLTIPSLAWSAPPAQVRAGSRELANVARGVRKGDRLVVKGLVLEGETDVSHLELERHEVWRPGAVILVDGHRVQPPATAFFKGKVAGDDASVAMISIRENGEVQGLVQRRGQSWLVGKGRAHKALRSRKTSKELAPFECGNDDAFTPEQRLGDLSDVGVDAGTPSAALDALGAATVLDSPYVASLAIDTDYEFFAKFGNTTAALDYLADLVGYADLTYSREIDTDMQIGFSRLFTGGASSDPWTIGACVDANGDGKADSSPCGTSGVLEQFRNHWNANMRHVDRTLAHLVSGKNLGGGIAYIGVLCQNHGSSKGSTYDYGVSASLGGNFRWDGDQSHDPSNVVWDIVVLQHEIGHNFNSPHSHDYCNIGGSSLPIDNCSSGCQSGASLKVPSCSSPTPFFTTGGGAGTIMSYCHLRSGGYGNIAMTFGEGHTCGTLPGREAARMQAHVVSRAGSYPTCFARSEPPPTPTCGNGTLETGEQCDDGNAINTDACAGCRNASCGDGFTRTGVEQCDDGNSVNTDACLTSCTTARCGDGYTRTGVEQCDDANSTNTDACLSTCTTARCGDGVTRTGVEQCDDGNAVNTDACLNGCTTARCGDGFVRTSVEQCDDANSTNTDACLSTCINARCGDGFTRTGVEQCDDANSTNTDACLSTCASARCGDGFVRTGIEACDDANGVDSDACPSSCQAAFCGDGFTRAGVEACDDGNADDMDGCLQSCVPARCGDGHVHLGTEECDDGNSIDGDGCSTDCLSFCDDAPRPDCRSAGRSVFRAGYGASPDSNVLKWRWMRGGALDVAEIGDPTISGSFNLCFYPNVPGDGGLGAEVLLAPGSLWTPLGLKGFRYRDSTTTSGGIAELRVGTGADGRTSLRLRGAGARIPAGLLPAKSFTVQLVDVEAGGCWSSTFETGTTGPAVFQGRTR